jgi:uncharacterized membrane protein
LDPSIVRIVWAVLILAGGIGFLLYIIAWIVVPEEPEFGSDAMAPASATPSAAGAPEAGSSTSTADWRAQRHAEREARRAARRERGAGDGRTASIVIGAILILIGIGFLLREFIPQIDFDLFWPLVLVIVGVLVLVTALRPRGPSDTTRTGGGS